MKNAPANAAHAWGDAETAVEVIEPYLSELVITGRLRSRVRRFASLARWRVRSRIGSMALRGLDIVGASCGLLLISPLVLVTAVAIKLESRGPVFYAQTRVGYRGRPFRMHKFRSMVANADALQRTLDAQNESAAGVLFKMRRDPRITRVGGLIRRLSIDELPQLWNVLRGDMALVGPRPALPREVAAYSQEERTRLDVKPGITCIWQVSGRSDIDFAGQVRLDVDYIRSRSLRKDIGLLLRTIPAVILGKGAY